MALQSTDIRDLVNGTLAQLGRGEISNLMYDQQRFVMMPMILRDEVVRFRSGSSITFRVAMNTSGAAKNVGLFQQDNIAIADQTQVATVPWRHTTSNYAWDEREFSMNRSESEIFDLIKFRRQDGFTDLAKRMEVDGWSKPADSTDDTTPFGIKYWIVASQTEGFSGGNPSGFSAGAAGLSSSTYPRWANWTNSYTNVSKLDLVAKMRKAMYKTEFTPPVQGVPEPKRGADRYGIYSNYAVVGALETLAEQQNEQLGKDIASMDGVTMFRRIPLTAVPQLDSDTTNPVFGINWSVFYPVFLTDWFMRETTPAPVAGQHTTIARHVDNSWNLCCKDRRRNWVMTLAS